MKHILYHYTSFAGLDGIARCGVIRFTDIAYLNDSQEWNFGVKLVTTALEATSSDESEDPRLRDFARVALDHLVRSPTPLPAAGNPYVFSLSAAEDELSLWRAYTARVSRFAIGFNADRLRAWAEGKSFRIAKLQYGEAQSVKVLRETFAARICEFEPRMYLAGTANHSAKAGEPGAYYQILQELRGAIATYLKHEKFEHEQEWRLSLGWSPHNFPSPDKVKYRDGSGMMIPFVEANVTDVEDLVVDITVGPTSHDELAKQSLQRYLRQCGRWAQNAEAKVSKVPFRDW